MYVVWYIYFRGNQTDTDFTLSFKVYRVYSNKRRGVYLIFSVSRAALIKSLVPPRQNILIV